MTKENAPMLSVQEYSTILKEYLKLNSFEIVNYEERKVFTCTKLNLSYFLIKVKILACEVLREVSFVGKITTDEKNNLEKEIYFYKNILQEINKVADVSLCPKFCFTRSDSLIIFEDFLNQGYGFAENSTNMDANHLKITIQSLAKLHAGSLIFELTKAKEFGKNINLPDVFDDVKTGDDALNNPLFKLEIKQLKNVIEFLSNNCLVDKKLNDKFDEVVNYSIELMKSKELKNVLCHGNLVGQNILFKYDQTNEPIDCKLINFELQQYNPPAFDLLQFIFMSTTTKMRKNWLDELLQWYYVCFKSELKKKNFKANKIISYKEDYDVSIYCFLPYIKLRTACLKLTQSLRFNQTDDLKEIFYSNNGSKKLILESINELEGLVDNYDLLQEDLYKIVKNKLKTTDYELLNYTLTPLTVLGFLSSHKKLNITVSTNNKEKTFHLFAKFMPKTQTQIDIVTNTNAFIKEMFIYNDLIPKIKNAGIDLINDCTIPCYFSRHNNVLIFDDLIHSNYEILDPRKPFDLPLIQLVIKQIAKYHASSLMLEEKLSEKHNVEYRISDYYAEELEEQLFVRLPKHQGGRIFYTGVDAIEHQLNLFIHPQFASTNLETMSKIYKCFDSMSDLVRASDKFRNVVCHGDLWASNILVKSADNTFVDCRIVDYQTSRYCPPAHDVLILIYLTTSRSLRKEYFNDLVNLYYKELGNNLNMYGYDINNLITYQNFLESIYCLTPQAVSQAVVYFSLILSTSDILKKFMSTEESSAEILLRDRRDLLTYMFENDSLYRERVKDSLDDLIECAIKYY